MSEQLIYGIHAVESLLLNQKRTIRQLLINEERDERKLTHLLELAKQNQIAIQMLSSEKMKQKFPDINHQGIIAVTEALPQFHEKDIPRLLQESQTQPPLILILDGITDPHNLGACLRSADASGVSFVLIPKDKNAGMTPVVSKVASGAAETVPVIRVTNLARAIDLLKKEGVWVYGAAGEADESLYSLDLKVATAIIMGAEGSGMRRLTREHCDGLFSLPMKGTVSSLNVSVAAGICLYEVVRQREK